MTQVSQVELVTGAIAGKVVSFPTDTVPALGVQPHHGDLIFSLKKRPQTKPLILMGASWRDLLPYIQGTPSELTHWHRMTQEYWPGALTLVLPASSQVPATLNPTSSNTIGIRVPNLILAQDILTQTGPLATTSANLSGAPPLRTLPDIEQTFPEVLTLSDLEAPIGNGQPSTVAQWTKAGWVILRQGSVNFQGNQV